MDTRQMASEYRLAQWAQAVQERIAAGETVKAFCENRGISRNTYFYWQQKLRMAAAEQIVSSQTLAPIGWAKAEVTQGPEKPINAPLFVEVNGCRITVDEGTDPELLAKVCRVLVSLC